MANYFLGSVGNAELFAKKDGVPYHFASARTLTDSSINLSVSAEEVRGGQGARLLGQFFHTSTFGITLTDAMFKLEYVAAQVGGTIEQGGYGMVDRQYIADATGKITLNADELPLPLLEGQSALVWYNAPGSTDYATYVVPVGDTSGEITIPGAAADSKWCVHYIATKEAARTLIVNSDFVPAELTLFLTTRLYAGDASAPETGKPVGSVTVKVPRFQLNGTMDIALAMASAATIQMQGNALSYDDSCEGGKYAEIVEFMELNQYDGYTGTLITADTNKVGAVPVVYVVGAKKTPKLIEGNPIGTAATEAQGTEGQEGYVPASPATAGLVFTPALDANGKVSAANTTVALNYYDNNNVIQTIPAYTTGA